MLASTSIKVSLRFESVLYFELISGCGVRCVPAFAIPVYRCLIVPLPSVERTVLPSLSCFYTLSAVSWASLWRPVSGVSARLHRSVWLFFHQCLPLLVTAPTWCLSLKHSDSSHLIFISPNYFCYSFAFSYTFYK